MPSQLTQLLRLIGRRDDELIPISAEPPGGKFGLAAWTTVADADETVDGLSGQSVWYGVQPLGVVEGGRGKAADVTEICCLYADIDYLREGKPGGVDPLVALEIVNDLAAILGVAPVAIVRSGGGLQPYWAIERVDAFAGVEILRWWREQVIATAAELGAKVDTGVFDLARVLRVPGPPNLKDVYGPGGAPTSLTVRAGRMITRAELEQVIAGRPMVGKTRVTPDGLSVPVRGQHQEGDRIFGDLDDALRYLKGAGGALDAMSKTTEGSGFNNALNAAAFDVGAFIGQGDDEDDPGDGFLTVKQAYELVSEYLEKQFPGGPDARDNATIESGFKQAQWLARRPVENDGDGNPFGSASEITLARAAWERNGCRVATTREMASQRSEIPHPRASEDNPNPGGAAPDDPGEDTFLSEAFWAARPVFGHLRRAAWATMQSPEGILTAALAITAAHTMPNIVLPAVIGTEASLNLMTVICGDPGDGKSVCRKIAQKVLDFSDSPEVYQFNPSSGQGLAGRYQVLQKVRGGPAEMIRTRFRAIGVVEESDTIAALAANPNSTLSSELRKAAMGESLGFGNVGETQTNIPEHEYRFVMMMCLQPELGGWLLGDAAGGLPQRFLWCSVRDPRVVDDIELPGLFPIAIPFEAKPDPISHGPRGRRVMGVAAAVAVEIKEAARQRKILGREAGRDLDGHAILMRLKVAGALCVLDGRLDITETDWDLAGAILGVSDASRAWVQSAVAARAARDNERAAKARGRARLIEETIVSADVDTKTRARVTAAVLRFLERNPEGMAKSEIRRKLQAADRHLLDEGILDALLDAGLVRFEVVGNTSVWFKVLP